MKSTNILEITAICFIRIVRAIILTGMPIFNQGFKLDIRKIWPSSIFCIYPPPFDMIIYFMKLKLYIHSLKNKFIKRNKMNLKVDLLTSY